jgi:hypothetical protein
MSKAFLSYVHEDSDIAERIVRNFQRNGIGVWRDKEELAGGIRWKTAIREAVKDGTLFIALHSESRANKTVSHAHEELLLAIEELRKRHTTDRWLIPLRIDNSSIDDRSIGGGETYMDLHVHEALLHKSCEGRDSSLESSMVAGMHEQTHTPDLQDHELAGL